MIVEVARSHAATTSPCREPSREAMGPRAAAGGGGGGGPPARRRARATPPTRQRSAAHPHQGRGRPRRCRAVHPARAAILAAARPRAHRRPCPGGDRALRPQRHPRAGDAATRCGSVSSPTATSSSAVAASEDPELSGVDLPVLNPDLATLRRSAALWRPRLTALLRERYGLELLAMYTYPAQVVFCRRPFSGLSDLAGRRVRASSVGQSELLGSLGAVPVVIPFAETVGALRGGVVECAITAAKSGNAVGMHETTSHLSRLAVGWGVSVFVGNRAAWLGLPDEVRTPLRQGIARARSRDLARCGSGNGERPRLQRRARHLRRRQARAHDDRGGARPGRGAAGRAPARRGAAELGPALRGGLRGYLEPATSPRPSASGRGSGSAW